MGGWVREERARMSRIAAAASRHRLLRLQSRTPPATTHHAGQARAGQHAVFVVCKGGGVGLGWVGYAPLGTRVKAPG